MRKIQKAGYTLLEVLIGLVGLAGLALFVAVCYVAIHFIRKWW